MGSSPQTLLIIGGFVVLVSIIGLISGSVGSLWGLLVGVLMVAGGQALQERREEAELARQAGRVLDRLERR